MSKGKYILLTIMLVLASSFHVVAQKTTTIDQEYKLKAVYIYKFTKYIEWSKKASKIDTFFIGVLGKSEIRPILNKVAQRKLIKGKPIMVHHYKRIEDFVSTTGAPNIDCHILFVSKEVELKNTKGLQQLSKNNVLVIGEREGFAQKGGLINFVLRRNKQKFEINQSNMLNCDFKVSPKLLRLAILVSDEDQPMKPKN